MAKNKPSLREIAKKYGPDINNVVRTGICGKIIDNEKFITLWITSYNEQGVGHTLRYIIWKTDVKSIPALSYGDRVMVMGRSRVCQNNTKEKLCLAEKAYEETVVSQIFKIS